MDDQDAKVNLVAEDFPNRISTELPDAKQTSVRKEHVFGGVTAETSLTCSKNSKLNLCLKIRTEQASF